MIKVRKVSDKYDIWTVEEKWIPLIGNKTKRSLEITPGQRELDTIRFKASNTRIKKQIEKEKYLLSDIGGKYVKGFYRLSIRRL